MSATTLATLRKRVAQRLGDYHAGSVTTAGTGALGSPVIDTNRAEPAGYFDGGSFLTTSDTPTSATVKRFEQAGFLFQTPVASISPGVTYEAFRLYTPDEYLAAINDAIRQVAHHARTDVSDTSLTFAYQQSEYTIPASFSTLHCVSLEDYTYSGVWHPLSPTEWRVNPGAGTLVLADCARYRYGTAARRIRLDGQAYAASLTADSDTTVAPLQFVVPWACAWLLGQNTLGRRDARGRPERIAAFLAEAEQARREMAPTLRHANTRRVRQP